jgi:DNA (cytosine-5)-methyltransferase 1
MNVGSLFSGIGGFDAGLERAGMRIVWQCESDDFCRRVLAKHWPDVPCYEDVCELRGTGRQAVAPVDVLCGGFPCQDLSYAGAGAGLAGARSGLWSEYARIVGELRPSYVVVENVAALLARGLGTVLADLAALGYDAEWDCIPASAVGAPHRRDRIWLVAYPNGQGEHDGPIDAEVGRASQPMADSASGGRERGMQRDGSGQACVIGGCRSGDTAHADTAVGREGSVVARHGGRDVADAPSARLEGSTGQAALGERGPSLKLAGGPEVGNADGSSADAYAPPGGSWGTVGEPGWWSAEPDVGRVAHGVPARVDRLRSLGNALVPQIAQWIGERIMSYEQEIEA